MNAKDLRNQIKKQCGFNDQQGKIGRAELQTTGEKIPYFGHMRKRK